MSRGNFDTGGPANAIERILRVFPGLLAGGLALVYVLGAIVTGSEMAGAGIRPPEAITLLSIEQLLARGVGVLVQGEFFISLLAVTGLAVIFAKYHTAQALRATSGEVGSSPDRRRAVYSAFALVIVLVLLLPAKKILGGLVMGFGIWAATNFPTEIEPKKWLPPRFAIPLLAIVAGFIVLAYTDPPPLSKAKVVLRYGGPEVDRQNRYCRKTARWG